MRKKEIQNLDDVDLLLHYYSLYWKMFILAVVKNYSEARNVAVLIEPYIQEITMRNKNRKENNENIKTREQKY